MALVYAFELSMISGARYQRVATYSSVACERNKKKIRGEEEQKCTGYVALSACLSRRLP